MTASVAVCRAPSGSLCEPFSVAVAAADSSGAVVVATGRDSIELRELHTLGDVARDRLRRHQILVAHCRRYFPGVEVAAGAITLQTS